MLDLQVAEIQPPQPLRLSPVGAKMMYRVRNDATDGGTDEEERMQQPTKTRALRCPCGVRMQARDDEALRVVLGEHIERQHPYANAPPEELLEAMVSSAVYGLEYVPAGPHEGLQEQGFGPEPY